MASGWMPRNRSSTRRQSTSSPPSREPRARPPVADASSWSAENEPQHARSRASVGGGGYGLDALYNEDFHHSARVALTGLREAYYSDYRGNASEWLACATVGLSFPGAALHVAAEAEGHSGPRSARPPVPALSRESRSGGELGPRASGCRSVVARPAARLTALLLLVPGHAAAVPGPGDRFDGAVRVLRAPPNPSCQRSPRRGGRSFSVSSSDCSNRPSPRARRRPAAASTFGSAS